MPSVRSKKSKTPLVSAPQPAAPPLADRVLDFLAKRATILALALIALATIRIVSTYTVFNHTSDEPAHIACGMQWLESHVYRYEPQHPPLTRVMVALLPYLTGVRGNNRDEMTFEGDTILYIGNQYDRRLALSRAGNLPFFWLACWMVFLWGRRIFGDAAAVIAVLIFSMTPTLLAHAGLSTTDIGVTAAMAAALYATVRFLEQPALRTTIWLGVTLAIMILAKFSALVYYPAALGVAATWWLASTRPGANEIWRHLRKPILWAAAAVPLVFFLVWAGYWFSFGKTPEVPFKVPFPELFAGIGQVAKHNREGHLGYLLGQLRMDGWWYFFPALLAFKLPIGMLALMAAGIFVVGRFKSDANSPKSSSPAQPWPYWLTLAIPIGIMIVAMSSRINIGLRHILPMFPFLALIAAGGAIYLLRKPGQLAQAGCGIAILWMCASSLAAHPDYIPYFNAFAGDNPEKITVDSDLDWGQDIKRLGARLKELNAPSVTFTPTIVTSLQYHGFPAHQQSAYDGPDPGWNAVQITEWKLYRMGLQLEHKSGPTWPDVMQPVERVGKTILLYYVPPQSAAPVVPTGR